MNCRNLLTKPTWPAVFVGMVVAAIVVTAPSFADAGTCANADVIRLRSAAHEACSCVTETRRRAYLSCARPVIREQKQALGLIRDCKRKAREAEIAGSCAAATSGFANNEEVSIHYVGMGGHGEETEGPEKPLVILIHGFPDFWYTWRRQMPLLADHFRVVAVDTRGYNLSSRPIGVAAYAIPELVGDIEAVIRAHGEESAMIVGHDWGAGIAWGVAMLRPELARKLVVLSVPHPRSFQRELATNPMQAANSGYARVLQEDDAHLALSAEALTTIVGDENASALYFEAFSRSDFEAMTNYYKANFPKEPYIEDTSPVVPLEVPTLILHGIDDPFLLASGHDGTWRWMGAPLTTVMLPGVSHWLQREASLEVSIHIRSWLLQ